MPKRPSNSFACDATCWREKIALAQQQIKQLTQAVDQARRLEAKRAVADAQKMQDDANPLLRSHAVENTHLAEDLQKLTKPIEVAERELKEAGDLSEKLREQFSKTREKAAGVGLTETIGQLLRKQREALKDPADFQRSIEVNSHAIDETQFKLYELDEMRSTLANPDPLVQEILASAPPSLGEGDRKALEKAARENPGNEAAIDRSTDPEFEQLLRNAAGTRHDRPATGRVD